MPMFKRSLIALLFIAVAVLGGTIYGSVASDDVTQLDSANTSKSMKVKANDDIDEKEDDEEEEIESKKIFVYVTGAVNNPGMVELSENKNPLRVADAVKECGGLLPTADIDNFNMAEVIDDGQHIRIPEKMPDRTVENPSVDYNSNEQSNYVNQSSATASSTKNAADSSSIVNINTAGSEELQTLKGIGPKMAERIIEYRQTNGSFRTIEEIQNVRGIGPKKFEAIKKRIRI